MCCFQAVTHCVPGSDLQWVLLVHPPYWSWALQGSWVEGRAAAAAAGACLSKGPGHRVGPAPWPEGPRRTPAGPEGQHPEEPWWEQWWGPEGCSSLKPTERWHTHFVYIYLYNVYCPDWQTAVTRLPSSSMFCSEPEGRSSRSEVLQKRTTMLISHSFSHCQVKAYRIFWNVSELV